MFADIQSNMYIYDEYCRLKPQEEWLDMANLPWIKTNYTTQRQNAYLQQTRCLYGKLEEFINKLKADNLWNNTVVIIQGTSGVNDFQNYKFSGYVDNFLANRLVGMAIHDNNQSEAKTDMEFCPTNSILKQYLFHPNQQCEASKLDIHGNVYEDLRRKLELRSMGADENNIDTFNKWYEQWLKVSQELPDEDADIFRTLPEEIMETDEVEDFGIDDIDTTENSNNLQKAIVE